MRFGSMLVFAGLCIVFAAGCGERRMNIKGRIVKGGSAFTVKDDDFIRLTFIPVMADGKPALNAYIAEVNNQTGTFKALGADLTGIPKGKYRITLAHERNRRDLFGGAYDGENSPFVFDINSIAEEIVLDLDKRKS